MKKLISIVSFMLAALPGMAQQKITVNGQTHPLTSKVVLADTSAPQEEAVSIDVTDGRFTFSGELPEGALMMVVDQENRMRGYFVADAPEIYVNIVTDSIAGSPLNAKLMQAIRQLDAAYSIKDYRELSLKLIEENSDNAVGVYVFSDTYFALGYDNLVRLLGSGAYFARQKQADDARAYVEGLALRAPGTQFRDLEEPDADGNLHKLSEYVGKGNYVLIDFWASWCGPCRMEMPNVVWAYTKYHPKGFNIVGLSFDSKKEAWLKAIEELKMPWIHLSDLKGWRTVASETYGIRSIPSSILVAPDGKIVDIDLRGDDLQDKLKEIYGE